MKDWDTLKVTAEELKAKGYYAFSSYADTFRLYGNSISEPWVAVGDTTVSYTHLDVYKRQILMSGIMGELHERKSASVVHLC